MTTNNYDFQVKWNPDVTGVINYAADSFDTEESATELLCDIQRTNNALIPASSDFSTISGVGGMNLNTCSGFAKTGAQIFNGLDANNLDAVENEWITLDQCLTHPTPFGEYHYH
jgi:hypothetical protein